MHKYLRAVGFSKIKNHNEVHDLILDVIKNATNRSYTSNSEESMLAMFCKDFTDNMGIAVCGEFDKDDKFTYEYYFPYFIGSNISSEDNISVERHAEKESYAGVCDDLKVGVSLIFYLQNVISYAKVKYNNLLPVRGTSLTLGALSIGGKIILPIEKDEQDIEKSRINSIKRSKLMAQAREGNEEAIETLTLEDMDIYNAVCKKIRNEDVLSLVDTYFMPFGVECDQYSILAEIKECTLIKNKETDEEIYVMTLNCNELTFDMCINKIDLYGEPKVGRRFKGTIWMQGTINFPDICGVS
ncbi:MAG: DUF3881 family protein [Lachnospiraceae bacterium]